MTEVSIDTLRAWERRHGAVRPARDERGRMYTDDDVRRIRLLHDAVGRGHSIGRIARLDDEALRQLSTHREASSSQERGERRQLPNSGIDVSALIDAIERFDGSYVEVELGRAAALMSPHELLTEVITPLLKTIGDRWHAGVASVAHEHLVSAVVRNVLGSLMRSYGKREAPCRLIFTTPAGERHEFGTLGAAMLAASGGLGAIYLGPGLPAGDIVHLTTTIETDVVVLGVTATGDTRDETIASVERLARDLPRDIEMWLGGPAAAFVASQLTRRVLVLSDFSDLSRHLVRVGARF